MNPLRGEVSFEADGVPMTLVFSIDSLCVLEDRLDMSVSAIGQKMSEDMRIGFLRSVFWAGLREHHPEISEREAGELITAVGAQEVGALIGAAFSLAFTPPTKGAANGADRPRKAARAAGTGLAS
jgi:hypothetical protein